MLGACVGNGTCQHGHRPAAVIYPQRASAVAACRSSGVVGIAADPRARSGQLTGRSAANCPQYSTGNWRRSSDRQSTLGSQNQIDDPPTVRQTRAVRAVIRPARPISRGTMSCRTDTRKRSTSLPTGKAPVANGLNHRPDLALTPPLPETRCYTMQTKVLLGVRCVHS